MSFRQRQKLSLAGCSPVFDLEQKTLENGVVVMENVNQSDKVLPDPALFDLENQLAAGVNLEEVNSKVLSSRYVDAEKVVKKYSQNTETKTETKTESKTETKE